MIAALLACADEAPEVRLEVGLPEAWSLAEADIQHHATTAFSSDGALGVAWTVGAVAGVPRIVLRSEEGAVVELGRGRSAAKPDLEADAHGRWVVGYQLTTGGIGLDRVTAGNVSGRDLAELAEGNNSVDLAVHPDGSAFVTWYEEGDPLGAYHGVQVDEDLQIQSGNFPEPLAEVVNYSPIPPDAAPTGDQGAIVAWMDQTRTAEGPPDTLLLGRCAPDGALMWTLPLAFTTDQAPRRPTIGVDTLDRSAVAFRRMDPEDLTTAEGYLAYVDADGRWLKEPFRVSDGVAEQPVLARLGDDAVLAAWSSWDGSHWTILAAAFTFPAGERIAGPLALSAAQSDAFRPHLSAVSDGPGAWRVGVSWEEGDPLGIWVATGRLSGLGP